VLTGRIDLCYRTEEGIVVLDYKTDRIEPEDAETAALRYRGQIAAYTNAVARAGAADGIRVLGVVHFIRTGQSVRIDPS
jgi:ATP-dependent exoDNAse (exonuclease V) beta subunit